MLRAVSLWRVPLFCSAGAIVLAVMSCPTTEAVIMPRRCGVPGFGPLLEVGVDREF